MDYGESRFSHNFSQLRSMSVRVREVNPNTGEITNFWESNQGWTINSSLKSFIYAVDPRNQLIYEECSDYASDGRCLEWLDMTDFENAAEFKARLENSIQKIQKEGKQTLNLVRVEIYDRKTGRVIVSMSTDSWNTDEVQRLFFDYSEPEGSDYKLRFYERSSEGMPYRPANPNSNEIKPFTEALRERFMVVRADNQKTKADNQRNRLS